MERNLEIEKVEGEVALVIEYAQGKAHALDVLQGAMRLIESLDGLDHVLLTGVDTSLEPVSILNDVVHSSLKLLLARAVRAVPDDAIKSLEWKKFVGSLLVAGKYRLLKIIDPTPRNIQSVLIELENEFPAIPGSLVGYSSPQIEDVQSALDRISEARALFHRNHVTFQTELGDIQLPDKEWKVVEPIVSEVVTKRVNRGTEFFKVKSVDMLGTSQWSVMRNGRKVSVSILDRDWLDAYHRREHPILPGDSLECEFEEQIDYDANADEVDRKISVIAVLKVVSPPSQVQLLE